MKKSPFIDFLLLTTMWTALLCGPIALALSLWNVQAPTPPPTTQPPSVVTLPSPHGYGYAPTSALQTADANVASAPLVHAPVLAGDVRAGAFNVTGAGTYRLYSSIGSSQTTITLSSFKEPVSNVLYTMSYINTTIGYGTIDPNSSSISEFVSFSGITQNSDGTATLTGVSRGLSRTPGTGGCVASTTLAQAHSGQAIFILSNSPCFQNQYAVKGNDETITGQWTFSNFPITATNSTSSETVSGVVQLATGAQAAAGTAVGSTGGRLVLSTSIASSSYSSATAPNKVIMTGANGAIDPNFLGTTTITFSAVTNIASSSLVSFTASTTPTSTWTKPANLKYVLVKVIGGGGGGGGGAANQSGGAGSGAGGAYCETIIPASVLPSTVSVSVGGGGVGGSNIGGFGGAGGISFFGSFCQSTGGGQGQGNAGGNGGNGGTATLGTILITGQHGGNGVNSAASEINGPGGDAGLGFGFGGVSIYGDNNGVNGQACGGGGSGGFGDSSSVAFTGGAGGVGCVYVYEFYY